MANAIDMIARCMLRQDPSITLPTGPETWGHVPVPDAGQFVPQEELVNDFTPLEMP